MAIKVLIVDDAVFMRNMIREGLHARSFRGRGGSGERQEASRPLQATTKPDLVTMDIVMP